MIGPYATPQAFRNSLEARLRNAAHERGTDLQRLQRRVAFERLLARLFLEDDAPWLLKGGYALELRLGDRARSTLDLDISVPDPDRLALLAPERERASRVQLAFERLQEVAAQDLGDGFRFAVGYLKEEHTGAPGGGMRCSVDARLAGSTFARFHLDVGLGDPVLDEAEWVEASQLLAFADIPAARVALYPMAQQFAEKAHAYTFPWQDRDNTRVKDLVDMVLLLESGALAPSRVRRAVEATFAARGTHPLPEHLPAPPTGWTQDYAALARDLALPAVTLGEGYSYVSTRWEQWGLGEVCQSQP